MGPDRSIVDALLASVNRKISYWFLWRGFFINRPRLHFRNFGEQNPGDAPLPVPAHARNGDFIYVSLLSPFGILTSLFNIGGLNFSYGVGGVLDWKNLAFVSGGIPCLVILFLPFIPESPRYFIQNERESEAEESLKWLRGFKITGTSHSGLQVELVGMQRSVLESKMDQTKFKDFFQPELLKPIAVCLSLMIFEQISGYNAIIFYAGRIFKEAGSSLDDNISSISLGVVQVVATVGSSIMVDRAGRRILLLFPQIMMGGSLVALGFYFYLNQDQDQSAPPYYPSITWIPLVSMIVFIIAFSIGIGPLSWTMMGEILPPHIKGNSLS